MARAAWGLFFLGLAPKDHGLFTVTTVSCTRNHKTFHECLLSPKDLYTPFSIAKLSSRWITFLTGKTIIIQSKYIGESDELQSVLWTLGL